MSTVVRRVPQQKRANFFQLCNLCGNTKITYYPSAAEYSTAGDSFVEGCVSGASLKYEGPEGNWTFVGSDIAHEDTSLGHLISVVLRPTSPSRFTFWLFLPPVVVGSHDFQSFTTYGVKNGSSSQRWTKQMDYEVERFFGDAKVLDLAL